MAVVCLLAASAACSNDGGGDPVTTDATGALAAVPVPYPPDNVASAAKVDLGRLLFWDPILSGNEDIACATCHHPDHAYTDGRATSIGTGGTGLGPARVVASDTPHETTRNAMTILDVAWNGRSASGEVAAVDAPMFWDDRAHSLEMQARGPTSVLDEMRGPSFDETTIFDEIVRRLGAIPEYVTRFQAAFGAAPITADAVTQAIATFERTLVDTNSSYDRYVGGDASALTAEQLHGLQEFGRAGCTGCHTGPMFSDYQLHRVAARRSNVARSNDPGAGNGTFRTASLRNVARTAPYMHDGALVSLDAVLQLYDNVDDDADDKLKALRVPNGSDRQAIIAFLGALSDGTFDGTIPGSVPSGLAVGGAIR